MANDPLGEAANAIVAQKELPRLQIVQVPSELSVGAEYCMVVLKDAPILA
jgi:molybdate transport system substrate-binding protein